MEKLLGGAGEGQGMFTPVSATPWPRLAWEENVFSTTVTSQGCLWTAPTPVLASDSLVAAEC